MALPPHFTTRDLSGRFALNLKLSDAPPSQALLALRPDEMLSFNHYTDENGAERIWVEHESTLPGSATRCISDDNRILDWRERTHEDPVFGPVVGRIRRIKTPALAPPFLRSGWTPDTRRYGVLQYDVSTTQWATDETWGIEEIAGERHFARHVRILPSPGAEEVERKFVYDYVGAV